MCTSHGDGPRPVLLLVRKDVRVDIGKYLFRFNGASAVNHVSSIEVQTSFNIGEWPLIQQLASVKEGNTVDKSLELGHHVG